MGLVKKQGTLVHQRDVECHKVKLMPPWIPTNARILRHWGFCFTFTFAMALTALLFLAGITRALYGKQLNGYSEDTFIDLHENKVLNVSGCPGIRISFFSMNTTDLNYFFNRIQSFVSFGKPTRHYCEIIARRTGMQRLWS